MSVLSDAHVVADVLAPCVATLEVHARRERTRRERRERKRRKGRRRSKSREHDGNDASPRVSVGLLLGHARCSLAPSSTSSTSSTSFYVLHAVPTPPLDHDEDGDDSDDDDSDSDSDSDSDDDKDNEDNDDDSVHVGTPARWTPELADWLLDHAKRVHRMCSGGISVLGVYICLPSHSPADDTTLLHSSPHLHELVRKLPTSSPDCILITAHASPMTSPTTSPTITCRIVGNARHSALLGDHHQSSPRSRSADPSSTTSTTTTMTIEPHLTRAHFAPIDCTFDLDVTFLLPRKRTSTSSTSSTSPSLSSLQLSPRSLAPTTLEHHIRASVDACADVIERSIPLLDGALIRDSSLTLASALAALPTSHTSYTTHTLTWLQRFNDRVQARFAFARRGVGDASGSIGSSSTSCSRPVSTSYASTSSTSSSLSSSLLSSSIDPASSIDLAHAPRRTLRVRGAIHARILQHVDGSIADLLRTVRRDLVHSLHARLALLAEDAAESESDASELSRVPPRTRLHAWQLPRRVFARVQEDGDGEVFLCDYALAHESDEDVRMRVSELLGAPLPRACVDSLESFSTPVPSEDAPSSEEDDGSGNDEIGEEMGASDAPTTKTIADDKDDSFVPPAPPSFLRAFSTPREGVVSGSSSRADERVQSSSSLSSSSSSSASTAPSSSATTQSLASTLLAPPLLLAFVPILLLLLATHLGWISAS